MEKIKKMTKKEMYERILTLEEVKNDLDLTDFVKKQIALLDNKNKLKSETKETKYLKKVVYDFLLEEGEPFTTSSIISKCEEIKNYTLENGKNISTSKMTSILLSLKAEGKVINTMDKKTSYYSAI